MSQHPFASWSWFAAAALGWATVGCESAPSPEVADRAEHLDDVVTWVGTLDLEETEVSLVASPNLRPDPRGGWLYWDGTASQVRRYTDEGTLVEAVGRAGDGPGEFSGVAAFVRLAMGHMKMILTWTFLLRKM
jgi:hypothetical protein